MRKKNRSHFFTLLEILIAFTLVILASSGIALKMNQVLQRKRFESDLARLKTRFEICHLLAMSMQADWRGILRRDGKKSIFELYCLDSLNFKKFPPLKMDLLSVYFEGEKQEEFSIDFFSSGEVLPHGILYFSREQVGKQEWRLPEIFQIERGEKNIKALASHPEDGA